MTFSQAALALPLTFHPPYDWAGVVRFLAARCIHGVEHIDEAGYSRTVEVAEHVGWLYIRPSAGDAHLRVDLSSTLAPVLLTVLGRLRHLFDLQAQPDIIAAHLGRDPRLAHAIRARPGLRVPGAFDGFELGVRAILGQQITVKGATTLAGRFADAFGAPVATPYPALARLTPTPGRVAQAKINEIAALGIIRSRARSLIVLAEHIAAGHITLDPGVDPLHATKQLMRIPGIGHWTAQYIAMRALRWPDAFPRDDIVLRRRLGDLTGTQAEARAEEWRPWRSYAAMHLWHETPSSVA